VAGAGFGGSPGWLAHVQRHRGRPDRLAHPVRNRRSAPAGLWMTRRRRPPPTWPAPGGSCSVAGCWVEMAVFSQAKGIWHPVLQPSHWHTAHRCRSRRRRARHVASWASDALARVGPARSAVIATAAWAAILLGRTPGYDTWLPPLLLVGGIGSAVVLGIAALGYTRPSVGSSPVPASLPPPSLLAGPAAYSLTTVDSPATGALRLGGAPPGSPVVPAVAPLLASAAFAGGGGPRLASAGSGGPPWWRCLRRRRSTPAARLQRARPVGGSRRLPSPAGCLVHWAVGRPSAAVSSSYLRSHQGSAKYLVRGQRARSSRRRSSWPRAKPVITMGGFNGL